MATKTNTEKQNMVSKAQSMLNQSFRESSRKILGNAKISAGKIKAECMSKLTRPSPYLHIQTDKSRDPDSYHIEAKNIYKIFGDDPQNAMQHVKKGVGKQELLEKYQHVLGVMNVDLKVCYGRIHVVMGLSGSGKSTLIRHLNRLIEPTSGEISVNGEDVLAYNELELQYFRQKHISMVFQRFGLMPHRSVMENVRYGLDNMKTPIEESTKTAKYWIERVGLAGFENAEPKQLSGGMQQRVGLARALATDSDIMLMDEAFSALDPLIRQDMQSLLLELQKELHKTIVFITHDLDEALRLADQLTILRDGCIVQAGDPRDIIMTPNDPYIKSFVRDINRMRVLRAGWVMEAPDTHSGEISGSITTENTMETASKSLVGNFKGALNVTQDDKIVGVLTAQRLFDVIQPID